MTEKGNKDAKGVVFVGPLRYNNETKRITGKSLLNYENAVYTQLRNNNGKVTLKARGRATGRAIDVASILQRKGFIEIGDIVIGSEEVEIERKGEKRKSHISTIEIPLVEIKIKS